MAPPEITLGEAVISMNENNYREAFADADGDMPEYCTTIHGWPVAVDKDGGGTLGHAYDGTWTVSVMNGPEYVVDNEELRTGTPKTHAQVARMAFEFASERDDAYEEC